MTRKATQKKRWTEGLFTGKEQTALAQTNDDHPKRNTLHSCKEKYEVKINLKYYFLYPCLWILLLLTGLASGPASIMGNLTMLSKCQMHIYLDPARLLPGMSLQINLHMHKMIMDKAI